MDTQGGVLISQARKSKVILGTGRIKLLAREAGDRCQVRQAREGHGNLNGGIPYANNVAQVERLRSDDVY